jgi:hypothetical protein
MSLLEQAVFQRLASSTAVLDLISSSTRITPNHLPQNPTLPALTYHEISRTTVSAFGADTGDAMKHIQISCWGRDYPSAKALAEAVRGRMQRWDASTVTTIQDCFLENEFDLPFDERTETYHVPQDYLIWFKE